MDLGMWLRFRRLITGTIKASFLCSATDLSLKGIFVMKKPSKQDISRIVPNTFPFPNFYIDEFEDCKFGIWSLLKPVEQSCLVIIARKTYGWWKQSDRIALSQLSGLTGLSIPTCRSAMSRLVAFGLVEKLSDSSDGSNYGNEWALQVNDQKVKYDELLKRRDAKKRLDDSRMSKRRGSTPVVSQDTPPPVRQDTPPVVSQDTQNQLLKPTINTSALQAGKSNIKVKPKTQLRREDLSIEGQIAVSDEPVVKPNFAEERHRRMVDAANLIDFQCAGAGALALAFMETRGLIFEQTETKRERKFARELLSKNVRPEHITMAVHKMTTERIAENKEPFTCVSLGSVRQIAIDLATEMPDVHVDNTPANGWGEFAD